MDTWWSGDRIFVEPDYFQFYLRRATAPWAADRVTAVGYAQRLWTNGAFVYVGTHRKYGATPVGIAVRTSKPDRPDEAWQHVVEVSLDAGEPSLEIFNWDTVADAPAAVVPVQASPLRLRASWAGLVRSRFEGLGNNGNSEERLLLELWPEPPTDDLVVRSWPHWPF